MSGVKGRSGRQAWSIEEKRHRAINKAWEITTEKLESNDKDRVTVALPIVLKDLPNINHNDTQLHISQEEQSILDKYIHPRQGVLGE
jgi:hypothetical protein